MSDIENHLNQLTAKLNTLRTYQNQMQEEINFLEKQLQSLKLEIGRSTIPQAAIKTSVPHQPAINTTPGNFEPRITQPVAFVPPAKSSLPVSQSFENFIGTNLISKVGILITIIGVFIGARYAIDKNLINPSTRILLAYGFSIAMAAIGLRLKIKYNAFSAILLGGGIAIAYFTTYIGYDYFNLIPQIPAFIIMVVTTIAAVALAIWYDLKIIALLGQVGAYAVPLLLSNGAGKTGILFSYITIINAGLIVLSFRKNWKIVYRTAFVITWMMFGFWVFQGDYRTLSWNWGLFFLTISFLSFYLTYLSYKLFRNEQYNLGEIVVLLLNGIVFYWLGYELIQENTTGTNLLTLFTIANASLHFIAGYAIQRANLADKTVKLFLMGQSLAFITIAIPVKLDGSWVTLLWAIESAIIVYVANRTARKLYFQIGAIVSGIAALSIMQDWLMSPNSIHPFQNETFFTFLIAAGCLLYSSIISHKRVDAAGMPYLIKTFYKAILPVIFLLILFIGFYYEIDLYYSLHHAESSQDASNHFMLKYTILILYSLLFCSAGLYVNNNFIRNKMFYGILLVAGFIILAIQLTGGFFFLGEMRRAYLLLHAPSWLIWIRYLSIASVALLWLNILKSRKVFRPSAAMTIVLSIACNFTILAFVCNEYLHWVALSGSSNQYKLGLTIICGSYALVMLFIGLIRQIKHLRIGAIVLFGATIIKLFIYDLASMTTISKTIIMILLGVLLLFASFLYNKYIVVNAGEERKP